MRHHSAPIVPEVRSPVGVRFPLYVFVAAGLAMFFPAAHGLAQQGGGDPPAAAGAEGARAGEESEAPPDEGEGSREETAGEGSGTWTYRAVSRFDVSYATAVGPNTPGIEELLNGAEVELFLGREGFSFLPIEGVTAERFTVAALNARLEGKEEEFSQDAVLAVLRSVSAALSARDYIGYLVTVDPNQVTVREQARIGADGTVVKDESGAEVMEQVWEDQRLVEEDAGLAILVYLPRATSVRTVASGPRVQESEKVNHPIHERVRRLSPIQARSAAAGTGNEEGSGGSAESAEADDSVRKGVLDNYTLRLNRHPGRRIDAALSLDQQVSEPGGVVLDYLVRENKPWTAYAQVANTGTVQTKMVRERFGFVHNQLTSNDDILALDYMTGGFDDTHLVVGSYDAPVGDLTNLRYRAYASYNEFDASEVGQADEQFTGDGYYGGGELAWNVYQHRELFIDVIGGARWQHVRVSNETVGQSGEDDFLLPTVGARLERIREEVATTASLRAEWNVPGVAGTGGESLQNLGRLEADEDWVALIWGVDHSFFLEPLLFREKFENAGTTLAHELSFSARGQSVLDDRRVPPVFQEVIGGFYSVRGYPESLVAGDNVVVLSAEYRVHLPRLLSPSSEGYAPPELFGAPFRVVPPQPFARPDWDLILRGFVDFGHAITNNKFAFEEDQTLWSAGAGVEVQIQRNLNLRVDWGVAMEKVGNPTDVADGSSRVHFSATILF